MFLKTVGLTILFETPVMFLGLLKDVKKVGVVRILIYSVLVNAITNIVLNVLLLVARQGLMVSHSTYVWLLTVLEMAVYFVECFMYKFAFDEEVNTIKLYVVVLLANAVSFFAGLLIF